MPTARRTRSTAVATGAADPIRMLAAEGADLNAPMDAQDRQTWPTLDTTPLQWAVARGAERVAALLVERGSAPGVADEPLVRTFLMFACWGTYVHVKGRYAMRSASALRLLRAHPELARANAYAAIVCGEVDVVARQLADDPSFARENGGPRGWEPLLYVAYGGVDTPAARDGVVRIAELLLDHGADPNAYYQAYDTPYTVLVGVAGEGEQNALPHPRRDELYRLLLARGAGPFDVQVLYNTHFSGDVQWWLQATWDHTHAGDRGAAWAMLTRALTGDFRPLQSRACRTEGQEVLTMP